MLFEQTTLAATASALAAAVENYGIDPEVLFARVGLDMRQIQRPGARYPFSSMIELWREAVAETADPCIGLIAARNFKAPALHALGLSWLASPTLLEGLHRIVRYAHVVNTSLQFDVSESNEQVKLDLLPIKGDVQPTLEAVDACLAVVVKMCRSMDTPHFAPLLVNLRRPYSLSQIAYLLGFSDQANFSRAFRRWTGCSPTEYCSGPPFTAGPPRSRESVEQH
jgi:AraC-like DNA-binding protein